MPFKPGQSGNPLGRPRGAAGVAKYIAERTDDCHELIDRLLELSRDPRANVRERFGATQELLSRAVGRPMQPQEIAVAVSAHAGVAYPPRWPEMTAHERQEWLEGYRARLLGAGDA